MLALCIKYDVPLFSENEEEVDRSRKRGRKEENCRVKLTVKMNTLSSFIPKHPSITLLRCVRLRHYELMYDIQMKSV